MRTPIGDGGARGGVGETGHCRKGHKRVGEGKRREGQGLQSHLSHTPHPTCSCPPHRHYLHRIRAHRLLLPQGLASSLEQKEHNRWPPTHIAASPYAWDLQRQQVGRPTGTPLQMVGPHPGMGREGGPLTWVPLPIYSHLLQEEQPATLLWCS